jgi:hypothetical protein
MSEEFNNDLAPLYDLLSSKLVETHDPSVKMVSVHLVKEAVGQCESNLAMRKAEQESAAAIIDKAIESLTKMHDSRKIVLQMLEDIVDNPPPIDWDYDRGDDILGSVRLVIAKIKGDSLSSGG